MSENREQEQRTYAGQQFDKLLVAVSGGGLVFSLTFLELLKSDEPNSITGLVWLKVSWVSFVCALVFNLCYQKSIVERIDATRKFFDDENNDVSFRPVETWFIITKYLGYGSFLSLLIGIIVLVVFAWLNT